MKIDVCSDLHVDSWMSETMLLDPEAKRWAGEPFQSMYYYIDWSRYKNPESKVLVIAGDISNTMMTSLQVIIAASEEYEHVVVTEGNHDHYKNEMSVESGMVFLANALKDYPNVHYLDGQSSIVIDGTLFLGATAWYDWKAYEDKGIHSTTARGMWGRHSADSRFPTFDCKSPATLANIQAVQLADAVKDANEDDTIQDIVMVTHMSPRADIMEWKDGDDIWNILTPSYVNTALQSCIDQDVGKKIKVWAYGHTHQRKMTEIDGVLYVNNARGYPRENPPFTLTQVEVGGK